MCSCIKEHNEKAFVIQWESSEIKYTTPLFYMDGFRLERDVSFVHKIKIANNSIDSIAFDFTNCIYELSNDGLVNLSPVYDYDSLGLAANDSLWLEFITPIKFTKVYNPNITYDSIYNSGDSIIKATRLKFIMNNDTVDIQKAKTFNTLLKRSVPSTPNKNVGRVTL
jgi:hypothetical protein